MLTGKVHGYHGRAVRDVPVDGRQVVVRVRTRQLVCPVRDCGRQTFREQVPGLLERHQRRTARLTNQLSEPVRELCGRASARLTRSLAMPVSYASALRPLRRVPSPVVRIPRVIGVDDFALRRRHSCATIIINAETGRRIEVLPGREAATTRKRRQQVHSLRERGVSPMECARRLNLALDTVKRYDRFAEPERLIRAPKYRPTLVDPYRDHLRQRRLEDPAVPVTRLLQEIGDPGYTGSPNLLVRSINQGRVEADRPALSPRRLARCLLTRPDRLKDHQRERIEAARTACQEMTALADLILRRRRPGGTAGHGTARPACCRGRRCA